MTDNSLLTRIPENTNFVQQTKFTFIVPNLPFARYFCQTVNWPSVSTSEVTIPTPFSETYRHGDKLVYEPLSITFLVDEDLRVWEETYNWLVSLTNPVNFKSYFRNQQNKPGYYDGIMTVNTNSNLPNVRIKYYNCHPITLSGIQFSTMSSADESPTADLTLRYDYFEIERL